MVIEKDGYKFIASNSVEGKFCLIIARPEDDYIIDMCNVEMKIVNELDNDIVFDLISVFGKAEKILEDTRIMNNFLEKMLERIKEEEGKDEDIQENS